MNMNLNSPCLFAYLLFLISDVEHSWTWEQRELSRSTAVANVIRLVKTHNQKQLRWLIQKCLFIRFTVTAYETLVVLIINLILIFFSIFLFIHYACSAVWYKHWNLEFSYRICVFLFLFLLILMNNENCTWQHLKIELENMNINNHENK